MRDVLQPQLKYGEVPCAASLSVINQQHHRCSLSRYKRSKGQPTFSTTSPASTFPQEWLCCILSSRAGSSLLLTASRNQTKPMPSSSRQSSRRYGSRSAGRHAKRLCFAIQGSQQELGRRGFRQKSYYPPAVQCPTDSHSISTGSGVDDNGSTEAVRSPALRLAGKDDIGSVLANAYRQEGRT